MRTTGAMRRRRVGFSLNLVGILGNNRLNLMGHVAV